MNNILSDLFLKIARKLGFELQPKQVIVNDFYDTNNLSITSVMADRLATLIVSDSDVKITGNKKAEEVLQAIADKYFMTRLKVSVVTSLGTGDCLVVPVTNGKEFNIDIIENNNFSIIDSIGDKIYSVVMKRDEFTKNNNLYQRFECHTLEDVEGVTVSHIYRYGYKNGVEIPLSSISEWEKIPLETTIPNVDRLLFGRYKCPTVNRDNINSVQGVPITYGLDNAVTKAKESFTRFNEEYERKATRIFAPKEMWKKDKDGNVVLPKGGEYIAYRQNVDGNGGITEFSPDLRYDGLRGGVEFNFKMLELFCGLSAGVLTDVESNMATATEIRASMNATFAYISVMRKVVENGTNDLLYAIEKLWNANSQSGILGEYEASYEWDYSLQESSTETFQQLLQAYGIGEIKKGEIRSWIKGISQEQAEKDLEEVEEPITTT